MSRNFSPTKTVSQLLETLEHPPLSLPSKKTRPPIDIQQIKRNMKSKWRDPGYCNVEFERPNILRAKLLTEWEYDRICLAERSYKNPKGYKGIKYDQYSRQFGDNKGSYSIKFTQHLKKAQQNHQDNLLNAKKGSHRGNSLQSLNQKKGVVRKMLTENYEFSKNNHGMFQHSLTKGYFGMNINGLKKIEKSLKLRQKQRKLNRVPKIQYQIRFKTLG